TYAVAANRTVRSTLGDHVVDVCGVEEDVRTDHRVLAGEMAQRDRPSGIRQELRVVAERHRATRDQLDVGATGKVPRSGTDTRMAVDLDARRDAHTAAAERHQIAAAARGATEAQHILLHGEVAE